MRACAGSEQPASSSTNALAMVDPLRCPAISNKIKHVPMNLQVRGTTLVRVQMIVLF